MLSSKFLGAVAALAFTVTAANGQVVVSSKIDTEGGLLGNVISQVLQANGIAVTEKIESRSVLAYEGRCARLVSEALPTQGFDDLASVPAGERLRNRHVDVFGKRRRRGLEAEEPRGPDQDGRIAYWAPAERREETKCRFGIGHGRILPR